MYSIYYGRNVFQVNESAIGSDHSNLNPKKVTVDGNN